jgi:hypothetical protein
MMRNSIIALEILGAAAGLYAAYCWWVASTGKIEPGWEVEPGEAESSQAGWTAGVMNSIVQSTKLNKRAAWWTGLAVLFGAVSSILSALSNCTH